MRDNSTHRPVTRRDFLAAVGTGLVLGPAALSGCGAPAAMPLAAGPTAPPGGTASPAPLYFARFGVDEDLIRRVLAEALGRGGDYADLYFQHDVVNYLGLEDGAVNQAYAQIKLGCGVRVLKGDQTGFAFTEDLGPEALSSAARTAAIVADAAGAPGPEAFTRGTIPNYYPIQVPWAEVTLDRKIPFLEKANAAASAFDKRVIKVRVFVSDTEGRVLVADSAGRIVEDYRPMTTAYCTCVAEDKGRREENYHSFGKRRGFEQYDDALMVRLGETAAQKAVVLFDAAPPPAGEYPVVLAPGLSGILLHEAMGHGFEADFNRKGISVYTGRIGQKVAPEFVTIVDDGTLPNERGSINVDDEGSPTERTVLVENGVLKSYLHDLISAKHFGVRPTGNGRRDCYRFPPVPRMRNTYMPAGASDPEEIVRSVKRGIYAETFTNGQVNIGAGDFSFYLKNGYLIEDGKLGRPVKDANLIGFGPKVLEQVQMVGNDFKLDEGAGMCGKDGQRVPVGMGLPTVKCGGISVGGVNDG
jgi:TldD protein